MEQIHIRELMTEKIVHSVDVTGKSKRQMERVSDGMAINLNHEKYYIDDDCIEEK